MSGGDRTVRDRMRQQIAEILDRAETELIRTVSEQQGRPFAREALDRELRDIRDAVLRMGVAVEDAIGTALRALARNDLTAADSVVTGDVRINEMQRDISALITTAIATQQPVARDLRFLLALDHVGYELERMGDHARSIAKHARALDGERQIAPDAALSEIGALAAHQLHAILLALVDVDDIRAREVAAVDDDIDARYHETFDQLLGLMRADSANVNRGTHLLLAAHDIERIGDRVTNIAEDVVFLARGEIEDLNP
jgi:phosphate transport system protein